MSEETSTESTESTGANDQATPETDPSDVKTATESAAARQEGGQTTAEDTPKGGAPDKAPKEEPEEGQTDGDEGNQPITDWSKVKLDIPDGAPLDQPVLDAFGKEAVELGLTANQANKLLNFQLDQLAAAKERAYDAGMAVLNKEWGGKFQENSQAVLTLIANVDRELGGSGTEFSKALEMSGATLFPSVCKGLLHLARAVSEDSIGKGGAAAQAELKAANAGDRLDALESAFNAEAEKAEAEAHPERLCLYVPCQRMASDDCFDPSGTLSEYPRECMIFRQGKTVLMVDTGGAYSVTLIRNFCRAIGVDHVDYLILSHYHADHASGFSGLVGYASGAEQNYPDNLAQHIDFSHCRVFLPIPCHEIDPSSDPASEVDTFFLAKLEELGIEPEYPEELDTLVISESLKVTFFNAGRQALNETREIHRQKSTSALDINDCSMCCLVQHGNATFFLTGDLTVNGEERLARKYQLVRRMELTPGALNPLPVSGSVPAGTLLTWDADFVPGPFDGVGPLASAENFYRKIFHPDVYKVGHHAFNAAGRATSDAYYAMLKPKAAFVATTYERDDAPAGKGHLETSASLLACPVYSAGLDDLKFVSDGIEPACVYGSMDWTGASRKLLHPGRHLHLYPALVGATGNHALWARIRFQEPQRPFSMCVHVSTLAGPAVESALLEFSCVLEPGGFVSRDASRARIISATAGFSGVFGMIHEGGGLVYLTVRKDDGVVWSATILSANFLESAVLASPVYKLSYSQATINGLAQPKWYKAAA